jgi:nitroreductase
MALIDIIRSRHSVRHYLDKAVERDKIELCLEAARLAPSATNSQPWRFVVVDEPELKANLCERAFNGPFGMRFTRGAPVIVAAVMLPPPARLRAGNLIRHTNFNLIDMGIAGEHFVLQAEELGLGTCWIGLFDEGAVKKLLGIPHGHRVHYLFSLGYPADSPAREHDRKPMAEAAGFNKFS